MSQRKRWLRVVRGAAWLAVLAWFGHFAYVRVTTPPAGSAGAGDAAAAAAWEAELDDVTRRVVTACGQLRPPRPAAGPTIESLLNEALAGDWTRPTRPVSPQVVAHITSPAITEALAEVCALADRPWRRGEPKSNLNVPPVVTIDDEAAVIMTLAVRAMYQREKLGNADMAASDLAHALRVAIDNSAGLGDVVLREVGYLVREVDLPAGSAVELRTSLGDERVLSTEALLAQLIGGSGGVETVLDRYYTKGADGNGWLVVSAAVGAPPRFLATAATGTLTAGRSGLWNLFSPIFADRRTVAAKLDELAGRLHAVQELPLREARDRLRAWPGLTLLDGPSGFLDTLHQDWFVRLAFERVMQLRSTQIALALSVYRNEHGEYPKTLAALVPEYLPAVPVEPFLRGPFDYERTSNWSYVLRAPGSIDRLWYRDSSVRAELIPVVSERRPRTPELPLIPASRPQ